MSRFAALVLAFALAAWALPARATWRAAEVTGVVNLNTATDAELMKLPGIGPAKAQKILEARAKRKFDSTDQIMRAKGIGRKTYRKLKPHLAVAGPTTIAKKPKAKAAAVTSAEEAFEELPALEAPASNQPPPRLLPRTPVKPAASSNAPAPPKSAQSAVTTAKSAS